MINKYEWNNDKEINDRQLFEEFYKSSLSNKISIYRILVYKRRQNIKSAWAKIKNEIQLKQDLAFTKFVLSPLREFIDIGDTIISSDIKNYNELMLIYAIMHDIRLKPIQTTNAIDKAKEEKSFNSIKDKMINFIKVFEERDKGVFSITTENLFIKELENLTYIPPITKKNLVLTKRAIYLSMMYQTGIGRERAFTLVNSLEKWLIHIQEYIKEEQELYFRKLYNHDSEIDIIDDTFRQTSQKYFYHIFQYSSQHP